MRLRFLSRNKPAQTDSRQWVRLRPIWRTNLARAGRDDSPAAKRYKSDFGKYTPGLYYTFTFHVLRKRLSADFGRIQIYATTVTDSDC